MTDREHTPILSCAELMKDEVAQDRVVCVVLENDVASLYSQEDDLVAVMTERQWDVVRDALYTREGD